MTTMKSKTHGARIDSATPPRKKGVKKDTFDMRTTCGYSAPRKRSLRAGYLSLEAQERFVELALKALGHVLDQGDLK